MRRDPKLIILNTVLGGAAGIIAIVLVSVFKRPFASWQLRRKPDWIGVCLWGFSLANSSERVRCTASERHGGAYLREILVA